MRRPFLRLPPPSRHLNAASFAQSSLTSLNIGGHHAAIALSVLPESFVSLRCRWPALGNAACDAVRIPPTLTQLTIQSDQGCLAWNQAFVSALPASLLYLECNVWSLNDKAMFAKLPCQQLKSMCFPDGRGPRDNVLGTAEDLLELELPAGLIHMELGWISEESELAEHFCRAARQTPLSTVLVRHV